ncbi:MAG: hypothetical protein Q8L47_03545 [bacterium]|nr:hypothetical protein [bacterium]
MEKDFPRSNDICGLRLGLVLDCIDKLMIIESDMDKHERERTQPSTEQKERWKNLLGFVGTHLSCRLRQLEKWGVKVT